MNSSLVNNEHYIGPWITSNLSQSALRFCDIMYLVAIWLSYDANDQSHSNAYILPQCIRRLRCFDSHDCTDESRCRIDTSEALGHLSMIRTGGQTTRILAVPCRDAKTFKKGLPFMNSSLVNNEHYIEPWITSNLSQSALSFYDVMYLVAIFHTTQMTGRTAMPTVPRRLASSRFSGLHEYSRH